MTNATVSVSVMVMVMVMVRGIQADLRDLIRSMQKNMAQCKFDSIAQDG